jgi:hypothetical protein
MTVPDLFGCHFYPTFAVARMNEDDAVNESTIVESQTVLIETVADHTENERLVRALSNVAGNNSQYVARRSTTPLQTNDSQCMERLFPHLITFGIGGLSTIRRHRYSARAMKDAKL